MSEYTGIHTNTHTDTHTDTPKACMFYKCHAQHLVNNETAQSGHHLTFLRKAGGNDPTELFVQRCLRLCVCAVCVQSFCLLTPASLALLLTTPVQNGRLTSDYVCLFIA